jgi:hypothetical protein
MKGTIFCMLLLVVSAACGGQPPDSDAADVVERYIQAKAAADSNTIRELLCSEREADFERESMSFKGIETRVENLACEHEAAETVACAGAIVATYGKEDREFPLGNYRVVQEDGVWKWCGESG